MFGVRHTILSSLVKWDQLKKHLFPVTSHNINMCLIWTFLEQKLRIKYSQEAQSILRMVVVYFDQRTGCLLVEIDFLTLKQLFPSLTEQNKQKIKKHLLTKKFAKSCFSIKKLILTSKRPEEHPFPGQNTQQMVSPE